MSGGYRVEDEEEWPKWTALRGTALTLDNVPLMEVFSKIQTQLEILKNRPIFDPKRIAPTYPMTAAERKASMAVSTSNQYLPVVTEPSTPVAPIQEQIDVSMFVSIEDFNSLKDSVEERLVALENKEIPDYTPQDDNSDYLNKRLLALENQFQESEEANAKRLDQLRTDADEKHVVVMDRMERLSNEVESLKQKQQNDLNQINSKVNNFIDSVNSKLDEQMKSITDAVTKTQSFLNQFSALQGEVSTISADVEAMKHTVGDFVDHKSVVEQRIVSLEFRGGKQNQAIEEVKTLVNVVNEDRIKSKTEIEELKQVKISREELQSKADLSVAISKADQSEIDRLEELTRELNRRLVSQSKDHLDALAKMQKDCEKKIDTVAQWCFKQLSNANLNPVSNTNGGGDIGKVKCLVCDQPIRQQTEQDVVFGGPQMTHSLKAKHRGQSPPRNERDRGRSPPPNLNNYHSNINNYHAPQGEMTTVAGTILADSKSKSKLTKLMTTPAAKQGNTSDNYSLQEVAEITIRGDVAQTAIEVSGDGIRNVVPAPAPESPLSRPITAPRVTATKQPTIVTSLSNPTLQPQSHQQQLLNESNYNNRDFITDFTPKKDGAVTGADTVQYFRELEGKFSGTGGRRLTASEIAVHRDSSAKRPGSAPMKRTHNSAKLQALGKPTFGVGSSNPSNEKNPLLPPF